MVTGTIAYLVFEIIRKANKDTRVLKVHYILLKTVVIAFLIPLCFLVEIMVRREKGVWTNPLFAATPVLQIIAICILCLWVCGAIIHLVKIIKETKIYRLSLKIYEETHEYDVPLQKIKEVLCIRGMIRVLKGDYYESPFYTGAFYPKVCLPETDFSEMELEHIFIHELTHYKHKDMCFLGLIKILEVVYWFHPAFNKNRLLLQYRELMEDACDIDVCNHVENHGNYIAVLLRMVLKTADMQYIAPIFLSESYEDVMRRIDNMEKYKRQRPIKRLIVTAIIVAVFCGSTFAVYAAEKGMVTGYEKAYDATWAGLEEEMNGNTENTLVEVYELSTEDEGITVEYVEDEMSTYSTAYYVDYTVNASSEIRKTSTHALEAGDKILVSLTVDPDDKNVKVGFFMSNGYVRYITGSGNIYHTFTIYDDDNYRFFIQNNNSTAVDIAGYYSIQ